jgi:signal transduction histidine kinase
MSSMPRNSRPYSIAFKLTIFYAVFFGIVAGGGILVLYNLVSAHTLSAIDEDLLKRRDEIALAVAKLSRADLHMEFAADSDAYGRQEYFIRLLDTQGRTLVSSDTSGWPSIPFRRDPAGHPYMHIYFAQSLPNARGMARVVQSGLGGNLFIQIGTATTDSENFLKAFRQDAITIVISMLALGSLVGWWLARKAMGGVEAVTRTAAGIAGGRFSDRVRAGGYGREIDDLVSTFNLMADHVQTLMEQMRQINENIAHDLRSPITCIRGQAEAGVVNGQFSDEGAELAGSIIEECDRLVRMINTMLDISETEVGVQGLALEAVAVDALIDSVIDLFRDVAQEKGVELQSRPGSRATIPGDRRRLYRVLANLVDNAIKYSPPGGQVVIETAVNAGRLAIRVNDNGSGIPADDLPRIFERFYRADKSRHLPGNGLGLSLARAIVHAHGGEIEVTSGEGKGSSFTIWLPMH